MMSWSLGQTLRSVFVCLFYEVGSLTECELKCLCLVFGMSSDYHYLIFTSQTLLACLLEDVWRSCEG